MSAQCRSCGAGIVWALSETTGKAMPVDEHPVEGGNVALEEDENGDVIALYLRKGEPYSGLTFVSHFATCPNAKQHRKVAT